MKQNLLALLSGTLFGIGLALSQMLDPAKVLAFLDFAGAWDPSLAFVMAGAVGVTAVAWWWQDRGRPAHALIRRGGWSGIDTRLIAGSAVFGIGWGLVGFCPGPAISALGLWSFKPLLFVAAMILGMALYAPARATWSTLQFGNARLFDSET
ncbi:DUF6691 family protein [Elongatibacter sediminis]|uniref:DUF6691 family protein n=1 Tax=Elongatibacter sediminis TaxID=3119006 RepID=A0AAW9RBN6_9GAMM